MASENIDLSSLTSPLVDRSTVKASVKGLVVMWSCSRNLESDRAHVPPHDNNSADVREIVSMLPTYRTIIFELSPPSLSAKAVEGANRAEH